MSLYNIETIYLQRSAIHLPRTKEILAKFPTAKQVFVNSHWQIPELAKQEENVENWNRIKRTTLVIGVKSGLSARENGRSTDFIAPSHSNGCTMACTYCYVARRKGYSNPVTVFANITDIQDFIRKHAAERPIKTPNQCDPTYWTYEIGENSDCSADAYLSSNVKDLVSMFRNIPNAKACFATKHVNREMLSYDPQGKTRIRFSLMPEKTSKLIDVRTSPISERIAAINDFVDAGYEVHINLSPVIVREGWTTDYAELFQELNDKLSDKAKAQLKSEVIFLTHNEELHQINTKWHPRGEELLWTPQWQEEKISLNGATNLRYRYDLKSKMLSMFKDVYNKHIPYASIRYSF
jgi:spore photoproduct lyase